MTGINIEMKMKNHANLLLPLLRLLNILGPILKENSFDRIGLGGGLESEHEEVDLLSLETTDGSNSLWIK